MPPNPIPPAFEVSCLPREEDEFATDSDFDDDDGDYSEPTGYNILMHSDTQIYHYEYDNSEDDYEPYGPDITIIFAEKEEEDELDSIVNANAIAATALEDIPALAEAAIECDREQEILCAMKDFTLPETAFPSWAFVIPEDELNEALIQKIYSFEEKKNNSEN